jgi:hypothetical protein
LWRQNPSYNPKTLLLDEVHPGEYVPVATSLGGGAFVRYVLTDLIRVISLTDDEMNIKLPQIRVESRADNVINLGSMVVLSERALWQAIGQLDLGTVNWSARKEYGSDHGEPTIRFYIEGENIKPVTLATELHEALIETHEDYASFNAIMGTNPIRITSLAPGTYEGYLLEKQAEAADLGQLKPPRMQPSDQVLNRLLAISAGLDGRDLE